MKLYALLILFFFCITTDLIAQDNPEYIETEAVITHIVLEMKSRRSVETAKVRYVTVDGDTINNQVQLLHIPLLGSFKEVGDTVKVVYQRENPYFVKSEGGSFLERYTWHIIIALILIFSIPRILKMMKARNDIKKDS